MSARTQIAVLFDASEGEGVIYIDGEVDSTHVLSNATLGSTDWPFDFWQSTSDSFNGASSGVR